MRWEGLFILFVLTVAPLLIVIFQLVRGIWSNHKLKNNAERREYAMLYRQGSRLITSRPENNAQRMSLRTSLLEELHQLKSFQSAYDQEFGFKDGKRPHRNYSQMMAEFTDAIALLAQEIASLEQPTTTSQATRRGAAEWAEEGSYEVAEPEPPPEWEK